MVRWAPKIHLPNCDQLEIFTLHAMPPCCKEWNGKVHVMCLAVTLTGVMINLPCLGWQDLVQGRMPSHRVRGKPGKRHLPTDWVDPRVRLPPWCSKPYYYEEEEESSSSYDGSSSQPSKPDKCLVSGCVGVAGSFCESILVQRYFDGTLILGFW